MDEVVLEVSSEDCTKYKRLDLFLVDQFNDLSRNAIKEIFKKGGVKSDSCSLELKKMPAAGTVITVIVPEKLPSRAIAQNIDLDILYQDEHLVFVNKPAGMVTHPAPGNYDGTLVNAILYHCPDIAGVGDEKRPGIVHRLDKGTSGVMVIAKTDQCHRGLIELFASHNIERRYEALALGHKMERFGIISTQIARHRNNRLKMTSKIRSGKEAITKYKVIKYFKNYSHVELTLETGRTHQIRVHLCEVLNSPVVCDPLYGNPQNHLKKMPERAVELLGDYPYPLLHAKVLGLKHPITKQDLRFEVALPDVFSEVLEILEESEV